MGRSTRWLWVAVCVWLPVSGHGQEPTDVTAFVGLERDGRTLVPMRGVFELLGAEVAWDAATKTVTGKKGDHVVTVTIGSRKASLDGKNVTLDVVPCLEQGSTLVPLRFVAESLGATVEYDAASRKVLISQDGKSWRIDVPKPPLESAKPMGARQAALFMLDHAAEFVLPQPASRRVQGVAGTGRRVRFTYRGVVMSDGKATGLSIRVSAVLAPGLRAVDGYRASAASGPFAGVDLVLKMPDASDAETRKWARDETQ